MTFLLKLCLSNLCATCSQQLIEAMKYFTAPEQEREPVTRSKSSMCTLFRSHRIRAVKTMGNHPIRQT